MSGEVSDGIWRESGVLIGGGVVNDDDENDGDKRKNGLLVPEIR